MFRTAIALLLIGYLPGALIYRLPVGNRSVREALPAEERAFWNVILSLVCSSIAALALAAARAYTFETLLWADAALAAVLLLVCGRKVRLGRSSPLPSWSAALPMALAILGFSIYFFVPPAEYVTGGKDPGVYVSEGIQIAQRGSLTTRDHVVASLPEQFRDLFFPRSIDPTYYSNRFMGFFLLNPANGAVVGQFPHLYPIWLAIGYGMNGLTGVRHVTGFAAVLGLLAVYFLGTRVLGRWAALAGAGLLAVNVVQVWYARYPNAEIVVQPLVFAGLLAYVRCQFDGDRFFAPVSAAVLCLAMFAHLMAALVVVAIVGAALFEFVAGRRPSVIFASVLAAGGVIAIVYFAVVLTPYFQRPLGFLRELQFAHLFLIAVAGAAGALLLMVARRPATSELLVRWVPAALIAIVWSAAVYAYYFRTAGGSLAPYDADAFRTIVNFYVTPIGIFAALAGFVIAVRARGSAGMSFVAVATLFALFFFYKMRIVPEHFWAARRFLAVILPSIFLLAGAAAFSSVPLPSTLKRFRCGLGALTVAYLAWHFAAQSGAILRHVEYAGVIPKLEQLSAQIRQKDLLIVESRAASDLHVLALPLAYIYAKDVLVLATSTPDKQVFNQFLRWAHDHYNRVLFLGGGGTDLLSKHTSVAALGSDRFEVPEYETPWNMYPRTSVLKKFDYSLYGFEGRPVDEGAFRLDVGAADDLYLWRFHARERQADGTTFRWSHAISYASIIGTASHQRTLTLWLANGGRPAAAGPAEVEVFLNDRRVGGITVGTTVAPYSFDIGADLADELSRAEDGGELRLISRTWSPAALRGGSDTRELGVMVDRIEVR